MSDPSARQVELDALREMDTVNSNAKALDDKTGRGAQPFNMVDWQAQQKAMKEADRQSKSQSAQIRHSFKGSAAFEWSALEGIKQKDREKQRTAQKQLHNYRAPFVGQGQGGKDGDADALQAGEAITSGAHVQDAVSHLDNSPEVAPDIVARGGTFERLTTEEATTNEPFTEGNDFSTSGTPADAVDAAAAGEMMIPDDASVEEMAILATTAEEMVMVEKPEDSSGEEWISVPPLAQPAKDDWGDMTVKHMNFDATDLAAAAPPTTTVDVDFTFALVTLSEQPDVTKYLRAAAFIVGDDSVVGPAQIKSMQPQSADRPGVYSHLVTASLGLKQQQHGASIESRQQHVLGLLKTAVQDGSFFAVASTA